LCGDWHKDRELDRAVGKGEEGGAGFGCLWLSQRRSSGRQAVKSGTEHLAMSSNVKADGIGVGTIAGNRRIEEGVMSS